MLQKKKEDQEKIEMEINFFLLYCKFMFFYFFYFLIINAYKF